MRPGRYSIQSRGYGRSGNPSAKNLRATSAARYLDASVASSEEPISVEACVRPSVRPQAHLVAAAQQHLLPNW